MQKTLSMASSYVRKAGLATLQNAHRMSANPPHVPAPWPACTVCAARTPRRHRAFLGKGDNLIGDVFAIFPQQPFGLLPLHQRRHQPFLAGGAFGLERLSLRATG